jgi:hypothetical protein
VRQLRRSNRTWEDNIHVDAKEIRSKCVNNIRLPEDRVHWRVFVKAAKKLSASVKGGKFFFLLAKRPSASQKGRFYLKFERLVLLVERRVTILKRILKEWV